MKHYLVYYKTHSNKFNEDYIAHQTTRNYEEFAKTHNVVEAYECELGKYQRVKTIGRRIK